MTATKKAALLVAGLSLMLLAPQGLHAQAMIYPNAGQTPEQLERIA